MCNSSKMASLRGQPLCPDRPLPTCSAMAAGKGYSSDSPTFTAGPKSLTLSATAGAANGRAPQSAPLSAVITSSVRRWYNETKEAAQRGDVVRCPARVALIVSITPLRTGRCGSLNVAMLHLPAACAARVARSISHLGTSS